MAPIRYSLHYEDYSEHLMSRFGKLLQMQSLVDMTLMCSSHTLRVHKLVLSASSAYFQEVLQKQVGEPLIILKMRFSVLKSLVEFMYCGKTQCLEENLDELVSAAQFLKIKGLSKVTKEGLGITNGTDLPQFPPPVVISRPAQSSMDMRNPMDIPETKIATSQYATATSTSQPVDTLGRTNKEMVVRIPFDVDKRSAPPGSMDYPEAPRPIKPRRGRPSRSGAWEQGNLGRAAERALLRREQDSRKAIHHLKHLQNKQMQDYMDQVTLSQAVNSICGLESSSSHNYMNIDNDFMFMDQAVTNNVLDANIPYSKEHGMSAETITSSYTAPTTSGANDPPGSISSAMSQYVDALKNAGLPTDLPILFESGDGSYINVNEQVLLDMVQSNEIQYEVIEQPNIIKNVSNPNDIKSIDDLSKSIERGEILINDKSFGNSYSYDKDTSQYTKNDSNMNSLHPILSDNLESFGDQQNFVVLDSHLQDANNSMDQGVHDLAGIDGDVNFFTKSINDDVKKYYETSQLDEARVMEQLCPTSTTLDNSFTISLLNTKDHNLDGNSLNPEDLRRNEDCYDFGLTLQSADALECLMSTPKQNGDRERRGDDSEKQRAAIMKDLMNIENNMNMGQSHNDSTMNDNNVHSSIEDFSISSLNSDLSFNNKENMSSAISSTSMHWDSGISLKVGGPLDVGCDKLREGRSENCAVDGNIMDECSPAGNENVNTNFDDVNIPLAVGLLPLKQSNSSDEDIMMNSKNCVDDYLINDDSKCLKRKVKYKKF